jgi:tetratricopeptide (TPR) repeat protein
VNSIPPTRSDLRDPKHELKIFKEIQAAIQETLRGRHRSALHKFSHILSMQPDMDRIHASVGHSHFMLQEYDEAASAYRKALEINPGSQNYLLQLGLALQNKGELQEAAQAFETVAAFGGVYRFEAEMSLGLIRAGENRYSDALRHFEVAIGLQPQSTTCLYNLALTLLKIGDRRTARKMVERGLSIDSSHQQLLRLSSVLEAAGF